jgi:hypothetical protein
MSDSPTGATEASPEAITPEPDPKTPDTSNQDARATGAKGPVRMRLRLENIKRDPALMMRAEEEVSPAAIRDFAEKYREEAQAREEEREIDDPIPRCVVFQIVAPDGTIDPAAPPDYRLVDGGHRTDGMSDALIEEADFDVHTGTVLDAAKFAARANLNSRAVRWGEASRRNTVLKFLALMPGASNRAVADAAGVSEKTVRKHRPESAKGEPTKGKDNKVRRPPAKKGRPSTADGSQFKKAASTAAPEHGAEDRTSENATGSVGGAPHVSQEGDGNHPTADGSQFKKATAPASSETAANGTSAETIPDNARARSRVPPGEGGSNASAAVTDTATTSTSPREPVASPAEPNHELHEIFQALGATDTAGALTRITELHQRDRTSQGEIERLRNAVRRLEHERDTILSGGPIGALLRELEVTTVKAALAAVLELKSHAA